MFASIKIFKWKNTHPRKIHYITKKKTLHKKNQLDRICQLIWSLVHSRWVTRGSRNDNGRKKEHEVTDWSVRSPAQCFVTASTQHRSLIILHFNTGEQRQEPEYFHKTPSAKKQEQNKKTEHEAKRCTGDRKPLTHVGKQKELRSGHKHSQRLQLTNTRPAANMQIRVFAQSTQENKSSCSLAND